MVVANSIIEDMNMRFGTVDIFEKTVKLTFTTRIDSYFVTSEYWLLFQIQYE